jgi:aspartate 1-decarboxylase
LIERVGILPLEEVDVVNLSNGKRFSTYVFPGQTGKFAPTVVRLCSVNPEIFLIIYAYEQRPRQEVLENGHFAKVIVADAENRCQQFFEQSLIPRGDGRGVEFYSREC